MIRLLKIMISVMICQSMGITSAYFVISFFGENTFIQNTQEFWVITLILFSLVCLICYKTNFILDK